jgi:hypothetical protein
MEELQMRVWRCELGESVEESTIANLREVLAGQYKDPERVIAEMMRSQVWQRTKFAFYQIANEEPAAI